VDFLKRFVKSILQWDAPNPSPWQTKMKDIILSYKQWNSLGNRLDSGIRYHPVVSFLRRFQKKADRELSFSDVGSGDIGLRYFLKKPCVCIDIMMDNNVFFWGRDVDPIRGTVLNLPLKDNSVDVVVTLDTVDDVEPQKREKALKELFRTARRLVVIGVPYGPSSNLFVRKMYEKELQLGEVPKWREVDIQLGLPEEEFDELVSKNLSNYPNASIITKKNENLVLLELRWHIENLVKPSSLLYRPILELVTRLTKYISFGKCYRRIYYVVLN
jgi:hypothetical protein